MNIQRLRQLYTCLVLVTEIAALVLLAGSIAHADESGLKFAVIADHKDHFVELHNALTFIAGQEVDFIVVAGDFGPLHVIYPDYYAVRGFAVETVRDPEMQDVYFTLGNHDGEPYGDAFFQENIAPYYPANGPSGSPAGTIYSFDRGTVHIVVTNPYWNDKEGGYTAEQLDWIEKDLQASRQPIKFVVGHEPAFPMDRHVGDSLDIDVGMRDKFWSILAENGVQAFFCGHTHHLSVVESRGVYQVDAGEIKPGHLSIVIVEVKQNTGRVLLYETKGEAPEAATADTTLDASLRNPDSEDMAYSVVFSSDVRRDENPLGCFIQALPR